MPTSSSRHPHPLIYRLVRSLVRVLLRLLTRTEISGQENIPAHGPCIVLTNHLSAIDPPLIMAVFPWPITVFAGHTHRHEFLAGAVMNALGAIWVRRGEVDREALRIALEVLKDGGILGVAPEGTRSRTGGLLKGKIGAAYLAARADVPLVPVALTGTEIGLPALFRLGRPRINVVIGPPFRLPSSPQAGRKELEANTETIMRMLASMLPDKYRGAYRD